jgi:predicted RND superfamily exporter protein
LYLFHVDYKRVLEEAELDLSRLLSQRERIDEQITPLKTLIQTCRAALGLSVIPGTPVGVSVTIRDLTLEPGVSHRQVDDLVNLVNEPRSDPGITNAIRQVLAQSKLPLTAPEIRTGVVNLGVDLSQYVNASAVIHNTLTRLEKQEEVMRVVNPSGQTAAYALRSKNALRDRLLGIKETKE